MTTSNARNHSAATNLDLLKLPFYICIYINFEKFEFQLKYKRKNLRHLSQEKTCIQHVYTATFLAAPKPTHKRGLFQQLIELFAEIELDHTKFLFPCFVVLIHLRRSRPVRCSSKISFCSLGNLKC